MQYSSLELVTAPAAKPIVLAQAKLYLRRGSLSDDDDLITQAIDTATDLCETFTARRFITQTWKVYFDDFPALFQNTGFWPGAILLPYPPVSSVTHVKYYDTAATLQTLSSSTDYSAELKSHPARIVPAPNTTWPAVQSDRTNAVEIQYVCGYGASGSYVPGPIVSAIYLGMAHLYNNRDATDLPKVCYDLLWPYRDFRL